MAPTLYFNDRTESVFDVILCDWKMPGFDGMDVVEEIDRRSPESAVVMISGFPTMGRATEALKRGAMDYLPKPYGLVKSPSVPLGAGLGCIFVAAAHL